MSHLFVSHASANDRKTDKIADALEQQGITTWIDHRRLLTGDDWLQNIQLALETCTCALFIVSPRWLESRSCRDEFTWARNNNKNCLIATITGSPIAKLPNYLVGIQAIDMSDGTYRRLSELVIAVLQKCSKTVLPDAAVTLPNVSNDRQQVKVTLVKSTIGCTQNQQKTIQALGLKRINHSVIHADTPQIRGMINRVIHLLQIEELG